MPTVTVQFNGLSRAITGVDETPVTIKETDTYRDVVRRLGEKYPGLVGILIAEDGQTFLSSNMFVIDGDLANPAMVMEEHPYNGECLHLMSIITGG